MLLDFLQKNKNRLVLILTALVVVFVIFGLVKIVMAPNNLIKEFFNSQEFFQNNNSNHNDLGLDTTIKLPEIQDQKITIIFTGDIMLSRTVNSKMEKYNDYSWPFLNIYETLSKADLVIGNLESPFLKNANYQVLTGSFSFKANPLSVAGLKLANFGLLSLANNHTINQGRQGIADTQEILKENGIKFVGAGLNEEGARKPVIINIKGYDFAFLGYAYPDDNSVATEKRAGIVNMDLEKMENDINLLKNATNTPDFIVILMHAGTEYVLKPNWQQKEFARTAIDAGADLVIGHHPHWPQIFEFYEDKPIIYSLGNFVFDQMWSEETRQGLLLELGWQNGIKSLKLIPTKVYDYGQVKILDETVEIENKERLEILERIGVKDDGIILIE